MPIHGFFDKKIQKEAFLGGSGGKEGGGFGIHIFKPLKLGPICARMQKEF